MPIERATAQTTVPVVSRHEIPQNGGYMIAGYTVAAVIYLGYALSLWRRSRRALSIGR